VQNPEIASLLPILVAASEEDIAELIAILIEEQRGRALARGDLEAIVEQGFELGFDSTGKAKTPWIDRGIVVCPGSVIERSALSHDCVFVNVDDTWVWESDDLVLDDVRRGLMRGKENQRSISLLAARDGLCFDVIASKKRQGVHQMVAGSSYEIKNGKLELIGSRAVKPRGHNR